MLLHSAPALPAQQLPVVDVKEETKGAPFAAVAAPGLDAMAAVAAVAFGASGSEGVKTGTDEAAPGPESDEPFSSSGECTSGGRLLEGAGSGSSKEQLEQDGASCRRTGTRSSSGDASAQLGGEGAVQARGSEPLSDYSGGDSTQAITPRTHTEAEEEQREQGQMDDQAPEPAQAQAQAESEAGQVAKSETKETGIGKPPRPEPCQPCPRCTSTDTKFCYYNNYNVKQPRFYCKACQRYWTAGGTLRNVPVGAGRRKSKASAKAKEKRLQGDVAATAGSGLLSHVNGGLRSPGLAPLQLGTNTCNSTSGHNSQCLPPYANSLRHLLDPGFPNAPFAGNGVGRAAHGFGSGCGSGIASAGVPPGFGNGSDSCWANSFGRLPHAAGLAGIDNLSRLGTVQPALAAAAAAAAAVGSGTGNISNQRVPQNEQHKEHKLLCGEVRGLDEHGGVSQESGVHGRRVRLRRCSPEACNSSMDVASGHDQGSLAQQHQHPSSSGMTHLTTSYSSGGDKVGADVARSQNSWAAGEHSQRAPHSQEWDGPDSAGVLHHSSSQQHMHASPTLGAGDRKGCGSHSAQQQHQQQAYPGGAAAAQAAATAAVAAQAALQAQAVHVAQAVNAAVNWSTPSSVSNYWGPALWPYNNYAGNAPNYMAAAAAAAAYGGGASAFGSTQPWNPTLADAVALAAGGHSGGMGQHDSALSSSLAANALMAQALQRGDGDFMANSRAATAANQLGGGAASGFWGLGPGDAKNPQWGVQWPQGIGGGHEAGVANNNSNGSSQMMHSNHVGGLQHRQDDLSAKMSQHNSNNSSMSNVSGNSSGTGLMVSKHARSFDSVV